MAGWRLMKCGGGGEEFGDVVVLRKRRFKLRSELAVNNETLTLTRDESYTVLYRNVLDEHDGLLDPLSDRVQAI